MMLKFNFLIKFSHITGEERVNTWYSWTVDAFKLLSRNWAISSNPSATEELGSDTVEEKEVVSVGAVKGGVVRGTGSLAISELFETFDFLLTALSSEILGLFRSPYNLSKADIW